MEKPSKRNLFDDDSDEDDYQPGATTTATQEEPKAAPQTDEMEQIPVGGETNTAPATQDALGEDDYAPKYDAYD